MRAKEFVKVIKENATGGASAASGFAVSMTELGNNTKDLIKRQKNYTNQRTPGGKVKVKK